MKRRSIEEKLASKKQAWIERTSQILGISAGETMQLLMTERRQSFRINPLVATNTAEVLSTLKTAGWAGEQYTWMPDAYTIAAGAGQVRDSELVANGSVFI